MRDVGLDKGIPSVPGGTFPWPGQQGFEQSALAESVPALAGWHPDALSAPWRPFQCTNHRGAPAPQLCQQRQQLSALPRDDTSMPQQGSFPAAYWHILHKDCKLSLYYNISVWDGLLYFKNPLTPEGCSTFYNMGSVSISPYYQTRKLLRKRRQDSSTPNQCPKLSYFNSKADWTCQQIFFFLLSTLIYILFSRFKRPFHAKLKSIL